MEEKSNHLCTSINFLRFLITISVLISSIDCQPAYVYHICSGSANNSANANFNSTLSSLLDSLSSNATLNSFFTDSFNGLYGLYLCRGDISSYSCQVCVSNATQAVQQLCPFNDTAIIWFDICMLRYSNVNFIGKAETDLIVYVNNVQNTTTPGTDFGAVGLINTLISNALGTDMMFDASGSATDGYGLVQCTRDINETGCRSCFTQLIDHCCQEKIGWRLLAPSCNIRYEKTLFYQQASAPAPTTPEGVTVNEGKSGTNTKTIVIIVVSSIAATGALLSFCYCSHSRKKKRRQREGERSQVILLGNRQGSSHINLMEEGIPVTEGDDSGEMHYFNLKTIQAATNNFSAANKLGEGGFGPVYKGKLQNGREIAVKRLSMTSRQGLEEFRNEVLVIAKLQHKNLVRLLGYCWEADEKLLVYEYLANKSLDTFLFDQKRCKELDWTKRANIITGTARGLLYLHEDSRLKIIHRDLKASNVLLDDDMNPKISDFGTARIFGGNQIEANTDRVVGTYGYMAPEYALEGLISTKSDVYSFGILVLEIISGKKNRGFCDPENGQSFLLHAWQLWSEDKGKELIDPNIVYNCPIIEALRWIHISLLCVQDDPALRPTMSQVVLMIGSKLVNLPPLSRAPFTINTRVNMSDQSSGFGSSSLLISDQSTYSA